MMFFIVTFSPESVLFEWIGYAVTIRENGSFVNANSCFYLPHGERVDRWNDPAVISIFRN